jgi:capsular exopolysaccharide synthesis family protein
MNLDDHTLTTQNNNQPFNLKKTLLTYTKQWVWFLLSLIICLVFVYINLRYTIPEYQASSTVMLLNDDGENASGKIFKDLSIANVSEGAAIEDEILVFKSRTVLRQVVEQLDLNLQFFTKGLVLESEIYKNAPISINFIASDSIVKTTNFNFHIDILSDETFEYRVYEEDIPIKMAFGENIETPFGGMIITPVKAFQNETNNNLRVTLTDVRSIVEDLRKRISIFPSDKSSKILFIYLQDPIIQKAKDIINTLITEYDTYTVTVKNRMSKGTADFIDSRVELIASDLVNVDDSIVRFKTGNKVTDVASEAGQFMQLSFDNEQQIQGIKTQLRLLNYTKELLGGSSDDFQMIPSNLGDASISALSTQYNGLLAQRENYLKSAGEKNSVVVELNQTLNNIRNNLKQNIDATSRTLNIQLMSLENQSQRVSSKIYSVPGQESRLRSIERKQGIKESIYLYLLQKREEAIISQTVTSSNVKIIDDAYSLGKVSPNGKMLYIGALFLGLFIPFSIIYVRDLLDTKIHNKEDLENEVKTITVLGEIPRVKTSEKSLIERNDRSILSESFRIIRTNLDYVRRGRHVEKYDNVVFVSSTINGEGKSFVAINMALTLATTNKKVLLIGADVRNPKIFSAIKHKVGNVVSKKGLTDYLVDTSVSLSDTINAYDINDIKLDILLSGKIPPNPAELLMSGRLKELFDSVSEQYDYVIVDTAPAMLVTDTLLISEYAGHTIYLTRAEYTEKRILNFAKELHAAKKLNGMMLLVNDVKQSNFGYGAKYGYYGAKEKKWFFTRKRA